MIQHRHEYTKLMKAFSKTHQEGVNIVLHMISFPWIVMSMSMVLNILWWSLCPWLQPKLGLEHAMQYDVWQYALNLISPGMILMMIYGIFYTRFDAFMGLLWFVIVGICGFCVGHHVILPRVGCGLLWTVGIYVLATVLQLIGHALEGSSLAVADDTNDTGRSPWKVCICMYGCGVDCRGTDYWYFLYRDYCCLLHPSMHG